MIHTTKSVTRRYFLSKNEDVNAGIDDIDISTMPTHLELDVPIWLSVAAKFSKPKGAEPSRRMWNYRQDGWPPSPQHIYLLDSNRPSSKPPPLLS
ncbi:hypothetical protein M422DRAFT_31740, partial [Sphaerobolus stellatus SS14]